MASGRGTKALPALARRLIARSEAHAALAVIAVGLSLLSGAQALTMISIGVLGLIVGRWQRRNPESRHIRNPLAADRNSDDTAHSKSGSDASVSDRDEQLAKLQSIAARDPLTGLNNRAGLEAFIEHRLREGGSGSSHCLLFIDMDGFKQVNDAMGHSQGDKLLILLAERLKMVVRHDFSGHLEAHASNVALARFGGDEFVIFVAQTGSAGVAQKIANRILHILSDPFQIGTKSVRIGASIGVAFAPEHGTDYLDLIRKADVAMYQAKALGKNRCEFYRESLLDAARKAEQEENEVRDAIARGELELYFQPLIDARTLDICSAEALLRWNHPTRGVLAPADFFPAIQRSNLSAAIDEWVINDAVSKVAELERDGMPLMIAVNVSPHRLEKIEFPSLVRSLIGRWGCSPDLLQIEATEDAAVSNPQASLRNLNKLAELGVTVAIDDFGTGYSNLANLLMLPVSRLKIDRSLLKDIEYSTEAHVLVQTIISLANSLGFHSVAEGVENKNQMQILQSMGCDVLQGFLFSRPVTFEKLKRLSASYQRRPRRAGLTEEQSKAARRHEAA
ncbi:bifunctional diguanylate cyclase/phosphodiesterase [Croceicoccus sp. YJ47]|uniref:putative bifunctional diguanylate cyclase/phosphodiesterase n=1 Tax=Croceicoccus sp. YJ47 TaxID=2798724 RepID=UPI001921E8CB|nr:EAL domain-containing protein [Croceicoccus sp. YJ47]QQN74301.1 EAL domain-containing protein [Croceicoccus sp. YJ47]